MQVDRKPELDELDAIALCQEGDADAFRCLVERYGAVLQGTAFLMTRDAALAEELTQDAFLSAWRGIGGFKEGRPVKPWLVRILVNRVVEHQRRRRLPTMPLDDMRELASASRTADEFEARDSVRQGLGQLDADHRQVLMLRFFADLSVLEIAQSLGIPEGTVKSRLHRAMNTMRTVIGA